MATIKGTGNALTHAEMDANFIELTALGAALTPAVAALQAETEDLAEKFIETRKQYGNRHITETFYQFIDTERTWGELPITVLDGDMYVTELGSFDTDAGRTVGGEFWISASSFDVTESGHTYTNHCTKKFIFSRVGDLTNAFTIVETSTVGHAPLLDSVVLTERDVGISGMREIVLTVTQDSTLGFGKTKVTGMIDFNRLVLDISLVVGGY
jgi:hypothetical protein